VLYSCLMSDILASQSRSSADQPTTSIASSLRSLGRVAVWGRVSSRGIPIRPATKSGKTSDVWYEACERWSEWWSPSSTSSSCTFPPRKGYTHSPVSLVPTARSTQLITPISARSTPPLASPRSSHPRRPAHPAHLRPPPTKHPESIHGDVTLDAAVSRPGRGHHASLLVLFLSPHRSLYKHSHLLCRNGQGR
jgi:hypothetical protein